MAERGRHAQRRKTELLRLPAYDFLHDIRCDALCLANRMLSRRRRASLTPWIGNKRTIAERPNTRSTRQFKVFVDLNAPIDLLTLQFSDQRMSARRYRRHQRLREDLF